MHDRQTRTLDIFGCYRFLLLSSLMRFYYFIVFATLQIVIAYLSLHTLHNFPLHHGFF